MQLTVAESVVWNAVEGELVLLNANSGTYYALDTVGADVWRFLVESHSVADTKQRMIGAYDADPEIIAADVDRLVAEMLQTGLLVGTNQAT